MALFDTQLAMLANQAANALISGKDPPRQGNTHPNIVPYQPFDAADQPIIIAVGNDRQFARLAEMCGHPEWAGDERFATNAARVANRAEIVRLVGDAIRAQARRRMARAARGGRHSRRADQPVTQAFADVQAQHRQMVRTIAGMPLVGSPVQDRRRARRFRPAAARARRAYATRCVAALGVDGKRLERLADAR